MDVREELLERLVQHRPAPHDGRVLVEEEPDRHQLQVAADRRNHHVVHRNRLLMHAEHVRNRVPVHVPVEHSDFLSETRERVGEVGRERRLSDSTLARSDREDTCGRRQRDRLLGPAAAETETNAAFSSGLITSKPSRTEVTPSIGETARDTCSSNECRSGQPATVRAIVTETAPESSTRTSRTMSSSVTGFRISGSMTCSSAFRIASRSGFMVPASGRPASEVRRERCRELGRTGRREPRASAEIEERRCKRRIVEELDREAALGEE